MTENNPQILLVIPLYNHAAKVRRVVEKGIAAGWPVLVVDDGSSDGGLAQLADLACATLRFEVNRGKGAAILAGARWADQHGYTSIITVDADDQLDPGEAHRLAEAAAGQEQALVIGARRMDRGNAPGSSLFGRSFSNFWVHLESGRELPDTQSGFRLYPVKELLQLVTDCRRYDFEVEVLTRAAWAGLPILAVPVSVHYPPGDERVSHFHQFRDNFRLTCLHTRLVSRALLPWRHRRLVERSPEQVMAARREKLSLLHPGNFVKYLCREHSSALQLAVAAWLGVFFGALPLLACHTAAILYVCHRLHLNKVTAVTASQLCMPPVVPVFCIQIGYFLRRGSILTEFTWDTLVLQAPQRLWEWLLGSLLLGPLLGLLVGALVYFPIKRLRAIRPSVCEIPEQG
jgi:glycosyltransferase involved in cell wall biosynthesis